MGKKVILFGAGQYGRKALEYFGQEQVYCFVDNNIDLVGEKIEGVPVISFGQLKEIHQKYQIIIAVDARKAKTMAEQLKEAKIENYQLFIDLVQKVTKGSLRDSLDYIEIRKKAEQWIENNSIPGEGIINSTLRKKSYPEVTGYYIPTLLKWGYRERALAYAKWLCSIQKEDGSWFDTDNQAPYIFDTAQILKGLLAIRKLYPQVDKNIKQGCQWMLSCMDENGRLITPDKKLWGEQECSELIHLYCLEPLYQAAEVYQMEEYKAAADKVKNYYIREQKSEILNFSFLSHFYAYVMEALCDIGEKELAKEAMEEIAELQTGEGMVPAYRDVNWVCSTGLFQFAIVWYKLGELEKGNKAFHYACSLQNPSGGWYGGYATKTQVKAIEEKEYPTYFPDSEISWAVKYFFDALYYKCQLEFEIQAESFFDTIDKKDGRYQFILQEIEKISGEKKICDVGCGKGRYLHNLLEDTKDTFLYGVDLSEPVMEYISPLVERKKGSLTCCPYEDEAFDIVYAAESLEHAVCIENALKELLRVTKHGGKVLILDKNESARGYLELEEWEQWFSDEFFESYAEKMGYQLEIVSNISYDNGRCDGLFNGWILNKI